MTIVLMLLQCRVIFVYFYRPLMKIQQIVRTLYTEKVSDNDRIIETTKNSREFWSNSEDRSNHFPELRNDFVNVIYCTKITTLFARFKKIIIIEI